MKFDHLAGAQIDKVVVMLFGHGLVTRAAVAEIVPLDDADIFKQLDRAVNGGHRDALIDQHGPPMQFLDVGMVIGAIEHASNDASLLGHAHATLGASVFKGSLFVHKLPRRSQR